MKWLAFIILVTLINSNTIAQTNNKDIITEKIDLLLTKSDKQELRLTSVFNNADFSNLTIIVELINESVFKYSKSTNNQEQIRFKTRNKLTRNIMLTLNIDRHTYNNSKEIKKFIKQHLLKVKKLSNSNIKLLKNENDLTKIRL